jgi:hypothetical protein
MPNSRHMTCVSGERVESVPQPRVDLLRGVLLHPRHHLAAGIQHDADGVAGIGIKSSCPCGQARESPYSRAKRRGQAQNPPSTSQESPVTKAASSLAKKATTEATSDGWPMRPIG